MGQNHGAHEHACSSVAPLGSPQPCCQSPHCCLGHAPDSVSALSHSVELSWRRKAYGCITLCCPRSTTLPWARCPCRGGSLSPSTHRSSLCAAGREMPSPGAGIPCVSRGTSEHPVLHDLAVACSHQVLCTWGHLQSAVLFCPQGLPSTCRDHPAPLHGSEGGFGPCFINPLRIPLCRYSSRNRQCCFSCLSGSS